MSKENELNESAKKKLRKFLHKKALQVEAEAKRQAPVDTGRLRASIQTIETEDGRFIVGSNVDYAVHQEYGTESQDPSPFLRPAVDLVLKDSKKRL